MQRRRRAGAVPRRDPRVPVPWRTRLAGAAGGARSDPRAEHPPHRHARPRGRVAAMVHTCSISTSGRRCSRWRSPAYVFAWMRLADRRCAQPCGRSRHSTRDRRRARFVVLAAGAFSLLFLAASPLYLESAAVLAARRFVARAAAAMLRVAGVSAHASGQCALDAARRLPRHAGVHSDAADSRLSGGRLRLRRRRGGGGWSRASSARCRSSSALASLRLLVVALPLRGRRRCSSCTPSTSCCWRAWSSVPPPLWRHRRPAADRATRRPASSSACCSSGLSRRPALRALAIALAGAPRSTIRRARSHFCRRSRSASTSRSGSRRSSRVGWRRFVVGFATAGGHQAAGLLALHARHVHVRPDAARARRPRLGDRRARS